MKKAFLVCAGVWTDLTWHTVQRNTNMMHEPGFHGGWFKQPSPFWGFTLLTFVSSNVLEKHTASIFRVTTWVQVAAVLIQLPCKWTQYIPLKNGRKQSTVHCVKLQNGNHHLKNCQQTPTLLWPIHTITYWTFMLFHYQKWVLLKYVFRVSSVLNIHPPGGEDTLDIYCHIDMY